MSFTPFARDQYIRALESNETADMGYYTFANDAEIDQALVTLNVQGTPGGSETLQVHFYGSDDQGTALYSSTQINLADIDFSFDPDNGDWLGEVAFNFDRESIKAGIPYLLKLQAGSYTRNADTYYIGFVLDHPDPINSRAVANRTGARIRFVEYS